jgi:hypothetical protein
MLLMSVLPSHRIVVGADVTGVVARLRRLRQAEPIARLRQANCSRQRTQLFRQMEIERGA